MLFFDFITESEERNKGNYLRILYLISKKFRNKTLMIYSQSNNYFSKGYSKAGFVFKKDFKQNKIQMENLDYKIFNSLDTELENIWKSF